MRYAALYQTAFSGLPRPMTRGSHAFVAHIDAEGLEDAFFALQGESIPECLAHRIAANRAVRHTSLSIGDILIDADGCGFMVDLIGFRPLELSSSEAAAAFALHLRARGLEHSAGWRELIAREASAVVGELTRQMLDKRALP